MTSCHKTLTDAQTRLNRAREILAPFWTSLNAEETYREARASGVYSRRDLSRIRDNQHLASRLTHEFHFEQTGFSNSQGQEIRWQFITKEVASTMQRYERGLATANALETVLQRMERITAIATRLMTEKIPCPSTEGGEISSLAEIAGTLYPEHTQETADDYDTHPNRFRE